MRSVTVRLDDLRTTIINLGFVGENEHKTIRFDSKKMFEEYPDAAASLTVVPPAGEAYPAIIERDGDIVAWTITDSDLTAEGDGEIQLAFTSGEVVAKTYIGKTRTCRALVPTGEIPSGLDDFLTRAGAILDEVEDAIPEGGTTGQVLAKKSNEDYDLEWVDQTGGGGGTSDYSQLTNKPQIAGVTLNGNKTLHDLGAASEEAVNAKYTKPSGGIPSTDLAEGVQTSLGKADTAYQKPVSGIPASDMASGAIPDPTEIIDDTAGDGDTNKVWSADKSSALLTEINSVKDDPIPSAVKTALLALAENVAYATNQGPSVYNALAGALYNEVWPVTNTLSHCTSSNSSQSVTKNGSYSATITADTDYTLTGATVSVTMAGVDITSTAYSNGTISIASVTGVLSISITAVDDTPAAGYVTDGLVAYWDGIDNTENGHSASTTTWEDLIGSYDLTMSSVGGTWDTNAITFDGTAYNGLYRDNLWTFSSNATIEVVIAPASGSSTMCLATLDRAAEPDPTFYDARRFILYSDNTIGFVGKGGKTYTNAAGQITNIKKLVATYSGFTVVKAFANNEQLSLSNNQHSLQYAGSQQMRVGAAQFDGPSYPFNGKVYAIRVYNRQLTDDEITQNFNYDNERFSLGVS